MKKIFALIWSLSLLVWTSSAQLIPPGFIPPRPAPAIELSDPSATAMQVQKMAIEASVRGLYATVTTTMTFHNPNRRILEGDLVFPLPDGAAVSAYALDINGALVDGVVVKKEKARVAFETETRRRVDPGLVEHIKGNLYRTRIYPLPPQGARTIRLTYTTPLASAPTGDAALLLPMPRETIAELSVTIEVANETGVTPELGGLGDQRFTQAENFWRVTSVTTNEAPTSDIWVALPKLPPQTIALEKSPDGSIWFAISALAPAAQPTTDKPAKHYHILWDASGSRANADLQQEYNLLAAFPARTTYTLTVFRDAPEPPVEFKTTASLIVALKKLPYDGGTDFAALAAALPPGESPILLFTDGYDTLSGAPIAFAGAKPIAILSQTTADRESLRQACAGNLVDLQTMDIPAARAFIISPPPRVQGLRGTGIAQIQGLGQPVQGRVSLLGKLTAAEASVAIELGADALSESFELRAANAREGNVLATAWAAARVNQLAPHAERFEDELLALGRKYGLVSPATSLIVLESLDQWLRHEIEPPATQPALRDQYLAAMKQRWQSTTDERARHLETLKRLWKDRVAWWKTDFSKPVTHRPSRRGGVGDSSVAELEIESSAISPVHRMRMAPATMTSFELADYVASPVPVVSMGMSEDLGEPPAEPDAMKEDKKSAGPTIAIQAWNPDTPYLKTIQAAATNERYAAYLSVRQEWSQSPAFFLDCADEFLKAQEPELGLRILSNLAELRIEDAALLRVLAWRLQPAGEWDRAIVILRRIVKLRPEEPQSFRDLALALTARGKQNKNAADLTEAMELYLRVALTPWNRHAHSIGLVALEELNALAAWCNRQSWPENAKPKIPDYDKKLRNNLDVDVRIVMAWDADATDIDLHVTEPGGEEAYYGHRNTSRGGLVSDDITDGYGPEEYLIRRAPTGPYTVKTRYYGSRQQTVVGPATVTATVYTDWGRAKQQAQTLTLRLDKPREVVEVGTITFGNPEDAPALPGDFNSLRPGMTEQEVRESVGQPTQHQQDGAWLYGDDNMGWRIEFDADAKLRRVVEILPGGIENIVVQ